MKQPMAVIAARWVVYGALFIIPFLSLFVSYNLFFPFITGKNFAFRALVDIAVAAYAVLALADPKYRPQFSWTAVIFKVFVIWMLLADLLAVNPHKALWSNFERMDGWVTLVHIFVLFVIAGAVLSADKLWRNWWLTFVSGASLVTLYGLFQLFGWATIHQGGVRLDASLGNAEYLAAYLLFSFGITVWLAIESKAWMRYALAVSAALQVLVLYETQTRGVAIALIAGVVIAGAMWMFGAGKRGKQIVSGMLALFILAVGTLYVAHQSSFVQSQPALARLTSISSGDFAVRFKLWDMALKGAEARPITGWGQEGYNYVFNQYFNPALYGQESWFDRAHNAFLDWLVAGGVPAFLLFVALLVSAVLALFRNRDRLSRAERVLFITIIGAYAVQALAVFDNLFTYIPLVMVLATAHTASMRPYKPFMDAPVLSPEQVNTVATPIALVVGIALVWFVNVPSVSAASDLLTALSTQSPNADGIIAKLQKALDDGSFGSQEIREQTVQIATSIASSQTISNDDKVKLLNFAATQMQQEVASEPQDARLRIELAAVYTTGGDYKDAGAQLETAHELSPSKQEIIIQQATNALTAGDAATANTYFQEAYALGPQFDALAADAAAGKMLAGDIVGGKALLEQHFGTTTVDNNILLYAYYQTKQFADMETVWRNRIISNDTPDNWFSLAAIYMQAGDSAGARATIQQAIARHPEATAQGQALLQELQNKQ